MPADAHRPTVSPPGPDPDAIGVRHMHDVFASAWCRALLAVLQDRSDAVTVDTLTALVVGPDAGDGDALWATGPVADRARQNCRVYAQAMADLGIVEFDSSADVVWIPDDVTVTVGNSGGD